MSDETIIPSPEAVMQEVCSRYQCSAEEVKGTSGSRRLTSARRDFSLALWPHWSMQEIGRMLNRSHTTVVYYLGKKGCRS